jgi:hypothetical protein
MLKAAAERRIQSVPLSGLPWRPAAFLRPGQKRCQLVGEDHAAKIKAIAADLPALTASPMARTHRLSAMDQMLAANTELQQRLEHSRKDARTIIREIRAHDRSQDGLAQ